MNSVLLFQRWCKECDQNEHTKNRFKAVAQLVNIDEFSIGIAKGYNGKPFMISKTGTVCRGKDYICYASDMRAYKYLGQKIFYSLFNKANKAVIEFGFTIQGDTDDELPEQMVMGIRVNKCDLSCAVDLNNLVEKDYADYEVKPVSLKQRCRTNEEHSQRSILRKRNVIVGSNSDD